MRVNIFLVVFILKFSITLATRVRDDEVVEYVRKQGYYSEAYDVVTEDGYILRVHRIPKTNDRGFKYPVFVMHSAFSNSLYWLNTANISLGFYLADEGYDVYLGNVRGSKYATAHKWLSVESLEYWQFSFHEMGVYDLPAMIDFTLEHTKNSRCFYIGHSQASTQLLVFLSLRPEYNKKIIQSHLMSPIGAMANPRFPLPQLAPVYMTFARIFKNLPYVNFGPGNQIGAAVGNRFCTQGFGLAFCQIFNLFLVGGDIYKPLKPNTDPEIYRTVFPTLSPRTGVQSVTHYVQTIISKKFCPFDYGPEKNLKLYGSKTPPDYPLYKITSPVYLYVGKFDLIFRKQDTDVIRPQLPNVHYTLIPDYNHIDFVFARNARQKVYKDILHEFEEENRRAGY